MSIGLIGVALISPYRAPYKLSECPYKGAMKVLENLCLEKIFSDQFDLIHGKITIVLFYLQHSAIRYENWIFSLFIL